MIEAPKTHLEEISKAPLFKDMTDKMIREILSSESLLEEETKEFFANFCFIKLAYNEGIHLYRLASDFGKKLYDVNMNKITFDHIENCNTSFSYIDFPKEIYFDVHLEEEEKFIIKSAYILKSKQGDHNSLMVILPFFNKKEGTYSPLTITVALLFNKDASIEEQLKLERQKFIDETGELIIDWDNLIKYCLNTLLYINTGDPDLREYKAPPTPKTKKPKKLRLFHKQHENISLFDVTLVGYNFKKDAVYKIGSTQVVGHFRWQPYGENRNQVKLIWVSEHERNYGINKERL